MARKLTIPCKNRTVKKCSTAKRSCKWASGKTRKYCRKSRNTMKRNPRKSVEVMYSDVYSKLDTVENVRNPLKK